MPASAAQILANQKNAAKSTGPKTVEGKEKSRANALKHGLTGAGVVLPRIEAAEVERRGEALYQELRPVGELGLILVRHLATMSVRMERCVDQGNAALTERVVQALLDLEYPEGVDAAGAALLRSEAGKRAMFDPSPEATLARKYAATAERSFYRALKELRRLETDAKRAEAEREAELIEAELGSFLPGEMTDDEFDRLAADPASSRGSKPSRAAVSGRTRADLGELVPPSPVRPGR